MVDRELRALSCARYEIGSLDERGKQLQDWDTAEFYGRPGFVIAVKFI